MYIHIIFIHVSVSGHLNCEQCCCEHGQYRYLFEFLLPLLLVTYPEVSTGSCGNSMFNFLRIRYCFHSCCAHPCQHLFFSVCFNCFIIAILMGVTLQILSRKFRFSEFSENNSDSYFQKSVTCIVESRLNWVSRLSQREKTFRSLFARERR